MLVLVAMSGGVDSSVAAAVLRDDGHEVVGATLKLWGGPSDSGCCSVADVDDARRVAQQLGIDHVVFNYAERFDEAVVGPYVRAHAAGRTPNPCIECNRHLKFGLLLERAGRLGVDAVATGHHARIGRDGATWHLSRGADRAKDQSYVVHMLDQRHLAATLFPVGSMTKAEVRARAAALGLRTAAKPDSQDVCFVSSTGGRAAFLAPRLRVTPGVVVDTGGRRLGAVADVQLVTIGQRKGLGLGGGSAPRYVVDVDTERAVVTVGARGELLRDAQALTSLCWVDSPVVGTVRAQTSAHGMAAPASLGSDGVLRWAEARPRVAPGQSVVFYDSSDRHVLGGALAV